MIYFITVGNNHVLPALMLVKTLRAVSQLKIIIAGNVALEDQRKLTAIPNVEYIDENDIHHRMPAVTWQSKYRAKGWYKQQFLRLSIDRFLPPDPEHEHVVILDSEVFMFNNWDEQRFFEPDGKARCPYWISAIRKPDWDYKMYLGSAYLLQFLPECHDIMSYANSNHYRRHISGVQFFSRSNVQHLWNKLERETDLEKNLSALMNDNELMMSDHDLYGQAVDYGLFDHVIPTVAYNNLWGWYDNHDDVNFNIFKNNAMWSMCQQYSKYPSERAYYQYMKKCAKSLNCELPSIEFDSKYNLRLSTQNYLALLKRQIHRIITPALK